MMGVDWSFLKNQYESYLVILCGVLVFIISFTRLALIENSVIIIQAFASVLIICLARLVAKKGSVHSANIAWILTGSAIIIGSIYTIYRLDEFKDIASINLALLVATLVWAPIGAGFVVAPLMSVSSASTNVDSTTLR